MLLSKHCDREPANYLRRGPVTVFALLYALGIGAEILLPKALSGKRLQRIARPAARPATPEALLTVAVLHM